MQSFKRHIHSNRLNGIDNEWLTPEQAKEFCPPLNIGTNARFPVMGAALQRRGGVARHDAVAWGLGLAHQIRDEQERLIEGVRQVLVLAANTRIVREGDYPAYLNIQVTDRAGIVRCGLIDSVGSTFTTGNTGGRPSIPVASRSVGTSCPNAMHDPYCRSPWPTGTPREQRREPLSPPLMPHG